MSGSGNLVSGNLSEHNDQHGISVSGAGTVAEHNVARYNRWVGISVGGQGTLIRNNTVTGQSEGITLRSASNHQIRDNTINGNAHGVVLSLSGNNLVIGNTFTGNYEGLVPYFGDGNIIARNTFHSNTRGMRVGYSNGNLIYNNSFVDNATQICVQTSNSNTYNAPRPYGGNYWSDYDTEAEGCSDTNADGFCDAPYGVGGGFSDNLPWTVQDGWLGLPPSPPPADPGGPYSGRVGQLLTLDGSASTDPELYELVAFDWDLGDGTTASGVVVTHAYTDTGTYDICLTVTDSTGSSDRACTGAAITDNQAPVPVVNGPSTAPVGRSVDFHATGSYDPDGDPYSHAWDFGDGATAGAYYVSHAFEMPDTYEVCLTLQDALEASATACILVQVEYRPDLLLEELAEVLDVLNLEKGTEQSLTVKVNAALASLTRQQKKTAANQLEAFIHELQALAGKKIAASDASGLIGLAHGVIESLQLE